MRTSTWEDIGSSYLPGEITAAFLWAQMQEAYVITAQRVLIWNRYHDAFQSLEKSGRLRRPVVPVDCKYNAHIYYLLLRDLAERTDFIATMSRHEINYVFHYVPLHSSPAGIRYGRSHGPLIQLTRNLNAYSGCRCSLCKVKVNKNGWWRQ